MTTEMLWILLAMTLVTYPVRLLPALLLKRARIPATIELCMQLMPFCIMVSMIVIDVAANSALARDRILALVPVLIVSYVSGNMGLGVLVGILAYSMFMFM